jgi:hypothetical protein
LQTVWHCPTRLTRGGQGVPSSSGVVEQSGGALGGARLGRLVGRRPARRPGGRLVGLGDRSTGLSRLACPLGARGTPRPGLPIRSARRTACSARRGLGSAEHRSDAEKLANALAYGVAAARFRGPAGLPTAGNRGRTAFPTAERAASSISTAYYTASAAGGAIARLGFPKLALVPSAKYKSGYRAVMLCGML